MDDCKAVRTFKQHELAYLSPMLQEQPKNILFEPEGILGKAVGKPVHAAMPLVNRNEEVE